MCVGFGNNFLNKMHYKSIVYSYELYTNYLISHFIRLMLVHRVQCHKCNICQEKCLLLLYRWVHYSDCKKTYSVLDQYLYSFTVDINNMILISPTDGSKKTSWDWRRNANSENQKWMWPCAVSYNRAVWYWSCSQTHDCWSWMHFCWWVWIL